MEGTVVAKSEPEVAHWTNLSDFGHPMPFCGSQGTWKGNPDFDGKPFSRIGTFSGAITANKDLVTCKACLHKMKEYDTALTMRAEV